MAESYEQRREQRKRRPTTRERRRSESKRNKGLDTSFLRKASDSRVVVAALVPTVSFAAGSNLPGGYRDSDGMAILSNKPSFQAFVLADSSARWLTKLGVGAMVIAFMTNLYSVLSDSSAIVLFALYFVFYFCLCVLCVLLSFQYNLR